MKNPAVVTNIDGYTFTWADEFIIIKVSNIRSNKEGRITGELLISTTAKEYTNPLYPQSSLNFIAPRSRSEIAKHLKAKYPSWDWSMMIDQISFLVQEYIKQGEPVKELWTSEDIQRPEFLLEPFLIKGLPSVIFGEKGVTKSTLCLLLYAILTIPWTDNDLGITAPSQSIKTLYLDWELPGNIAQWNCKKLQRGLNLPDFPLYHRRCILSVADDIEPISRMVEQLKAEVVIIDSLARAAGGELSKDTANAGRFFQSLDKLGVTSLIVGQTSKDTETKTKSIYGNALYTYFARSIFEVCKSQQPGEDEASVALFHRWSNLTKLYKPMGFRLKFFENGVGDYISIQSEPVSITEFSEKMGTQARILDLLKAGAMETKDISKSLDITENMCRVSLTRLSKRGKVIKVGKAYGLLSHEEPQS